jgi:hypothetical protein
VAQAVSHEQAWVCTRFSARGICGGQSGTGQVFLRVLLFSFVSIISPWLSVLICHLGMNSSLVGDCSLGTVSPTINMNSVLITLPSDKMHIARNDSGYLVNLILILYQ